MFRKLIEGGKNRKEKKPNYFVDALVDAFAPLLTYFVLHGLGVTPLLAMIIGSGVAIISTIVHTVKRKKLDKVGLLVIAEIGASILVQFLTHDPRILLSKPSLYSAVGAVYLLSTLFGDRPITYDGARSMATRGDAQRLLAYEQVWHDSPAFRSLHRISTSGWALAFLADAILRVVIVYGFPMERAIWLSNVPHLVAMVLLVGFSAFMGKQTKPLVEAQIKRMDLIPPT